MQGVCKKWFSARGFGFIAGQDGTDYFVHFSSIIGSGKRDLIIDEQVEFDTAPAHIPGKPDQAVNVNRLS